MNWKGSAYGMKSSVDHRGLRGRDHYVIDIDKPIIFCNTMTKYKQGRICFRGKKTILSELGVELSKPRSWCLLETIDGCVEFVDMGSISWVYKTLWLMHENIISKCTMQKGIFNIQLP